MQQLIRTEPGYLAWQEVPEPELQGGNEALVRPLAVATCDLDGPIATGESPIPDAIAMGHECVAEVVEVGGDVRGVRPGDRVVVPFQISCGTCSCCRRGLTGSCGRFDARQMYGFGPFGGDWGGMLSDLVRVPYADAMLVRLPEEHDPVALASASDNLPDAWRAVGPQLAQHPGASVLVLGGKARSIGLYPAANGAESVRYLDEDPGRLAVASDLGADAIEHAPGDQAIAPAADIVVDAGATARRWRARAARPRRADGAPMSGSSTSRKLRPHCWGCTSTRPRCTSAARWPARRSTPSSPSPEQAVCTPSSSPTTRSRSAAAATALLEPHTKLVFDRSLS